SRDFARPRRRGDRVSNCVVGSGGSRLPCSTIAEHSVEGCDHFSHDGDDDDLGFFVGGGEAFVKGLEGGTVTACAEGGHVKDVTDRHPTTIDAAVSLELAAVEVIWREADEGGDLFAAHLPEFWPQGDERESQHRADTWHRGQQFIALSESHIGGNHLGQALVEEADIGLQSHLAAFAEPPQHGIFEMSRLVLDRNMLVTQLSPHRHDLGEPFDRSVPLHNSCRHNRDILCDQPRIEAIVLGQHAAVAGELTKLARVDTSHRQSRREQGTDDSALVTTARLKANCGDCERAQPCDQLGPAGCVVTYRKEPPLRQHHHVQAVLRHVDTAKREHGHLRIPSLLMRARALATVRVWKKRPEHKLTRGLISEAAAGFRSRRGLNYDDSAPVTPHNAPFPTYKTPRVHHAAGWRGRMAARGARAAAGDADCGISSPRIARTLRAHCRWVSAGLERHRICENVAIEYRWARGEYER